MRNVEIAKKKKTIALGNLVNLAQIGKGVLNGAPSSNKTSFSNWIGTCHGQVD
jgi:hypothetical protein